MVNAEVTMASLAILMPAWHSLSAQAIANYNSVIIYIYIYPQIVTYSRDCRHNSQLATP